MAKRGASMSFDENKTTKFVRSDVSLASVSSGVTGAYAITKPIRLQRVYWREAFYKVRTSRQIKVS